MFIVFILNHFIKLGGCPASIRFSILTDSKMQLCSVYYVITYVYFLPVWLFAKHLEQLNSTPDFTLNFLLSQIDLKFSFEAKCSL